MKFMALKNLNTEEMIGLSSTWVSPGTSRTLLEKHPRTAGNVADLVAAHEALVKAQNKTQQQDENLTAIMANAKATDQLFDRKARGINLVLAGLAELADDTAQARALAEAQALLHPNGLAFVNQNYNAEAGVAELTRHRLKGSPEVGALLASLPVLSGKTLADEVTTWLNAGDTLRQLEAERIALVDQNAPPPEQISDRKAQTLARNRWIRVVRSVLDQITLDAPPDPDLRRIVLRPVAEAEARADARTGRTATAPPDPTDPPGDDPPA